MREGGIINNTNVYMYSRGHNKVPVPFASPFRATVLTISVPFPFRVRVWPRVRLNGRVRSVFLGCCGKV